MSDYDVSRMEEIMAQPHPRDLEWEAMLAALDTDQEKLDWQQELAALRAKVALFDWLGDGIAGGDVNITVDDTKNGYPVTIDVFIGSTQPRECRTYTAPTLAEAIEKAMEAEGGDE